MTPRPVPARACLSRAELRVRTTPLTLALAVTLSACGGGRAPSPASPAPARAPTPQFERPEGRRPTAAVAPGASLFIPVMGIRPEQLRDTYSDPRTGHVHHAIDIMAP